MIRPYQCPCGKKGDHDHGLKFTPPVEGRMKMGGREYEIVRKRPPYSSTWVLRERPPAEDVFEIYEEPFNKEHAGVIARMIGR